MSSPEPDEEAAAVGPLRTPSVSSVNGPELCVGAVVVREGSILLIRRGNPPGEGRWSVPGGRVHRGERLVDAVRRELREETGLDGHVGDAMGWTELIGRRRHYVVVDYWVTVTPDGPPRAGSDATDAAWVGLDDVDRWDLVDGLRQFLADHHVIEKVAEQAVEQATET
ncbi:NUDIX hydrolase [Candidatus Poriferisocius sp.]|uniref:NUDIX hydrolase n=1 Tax=Candidatus Poriferisocius sp. TaxID=3101276 RepID=UPI003B5AE069